MIDRMRWNKESEIILLRLIQSFTFGGNLEKLRSVHVYRIIMISVDGGSDDDLCNFYDKLFCCIFIPFLSGELSLCGGH